MPNEELTKSEKQSISYQKWKAKHASKNQFKRTFMLTDNEHEIIARMVKGWHEVVSVDDVVEQMKADIIAAKARKEAKEAAENAA